MALPGSVAIVTGGGKGLGRALCVELARAGAEAVIVNYGHSTSEAEATVGQVRAVGVQAVAIRADVADEKQVAAMVDETVERFGGVDVLINNAAVRRAIPHEDLAALDREVWDELLGVNLLGAFWCAREAAPHLRARRGAIVNIASIAGLRGTGSSIPYAVAKAGLIQLTRSLARALAPEVRVNAVAPGRIVTDAYGELLGADAIAREDADSLARTPIGRLCTPEEGARVVRAVLEMDVVTGETIVMDGGRAILY